MDLHLLRVFKSIAEEQSLTKAANRLHTVQSNLSARLKQLETELNCTLFSRTKKGMYLTEAGEKLLPHAKDMLERETDIINTMQNIHAPEKVTLGVPDTFMRTYLHYPLQHWTKNNKNTKLRIKTAYSHQIIESLQNRSIDIGVVIARKKPTNLHLISEIKTDLCVVTPKTVTNISANNLRSLQPMLLGDACFFGQSVLQLYNEIGIIAERHEYLFSIESILQCIALGLGISVLPSCLMRQHPLKKNTNTLPFPGKKTFSFYTVCLPSRAQSALVKEMSIYLK